MKKEKINISFILNIIIVIMVLIGTISMVTGFKFMASIEVLTSTGMHAFKYFTVLSNILVGLASLILLIYEYLLNNKRIKKIPKYAFLLKYMGTVAVSLTFLVTLFYLSPSLGSKFWFLYQNANLIFHFLVPVLSFISFCFFEKAELSFKYTFYSLLPTFLYGIYYTINALIHMEEGIVAIEYDWYGFVKSGLLSVFIVFPLIIFITYIIGYLIFRINKKKSV